MQQLSLEFRTGLQLRDAGIDAVAEKSGDWQQYARSLIEQLAASGREFSPDDFHELLELSPHHPNAIGAAFRKAMQDGIIRRVAATESKRQAAHSRLISVYRGFSSPHTIS